MGVSRGRWEGDTLVIETTNFNGKNPFRGSTENMKVVERLRRVSDDTIEQLHSRRQEHVGETVVRRGPHAKGQWPALRTCVP